MRILICNGGTHPELRWVAARCVELGHDVTYSTSLGVTTHEFSAAHNSKLVPRMLLREMGKRVLPDPIESRHVRRSSLAREFLSVAATRRRRTGLATQLIDSRNRAVDAATTRLARSFSPDAVITQSLSGWKLPEYCSSRNIPLTVNIGLPTGPVIDEILANEREANPSWAYFLQGGEPRPREHRSAAAELSIATNAIVASNFTATSLQPRGYSGNVILAPLGVPVKPTIAVHQNRRKAESPRILFVGQISQRKGLSYLFEAMKAGLPGNPHLTLAGADYKGMTARLRSSYPKVRAHFTGPLSRQELSKLYSSHTIFAFPSLTEGFGLALVEAMAHGMPVIATQNSAAPELFGRDEAGLLVPAGNSTALQAALAKLLDDESLRESISRAAAITAERMSWTTFADTVASHLAGPAS
jgi:glycosyltransferase involved in cell wall biosynthesis